MNIHQILLSLKVCIDSFRIFTLSLGEPVCWIMDKTTASVLDIGCGQGLPMQMIKMRMKVKKSIGVDLFKPYIEGCKKLKIHNKYIFSDIRKLKLKERSYDVVIALQVLEHLKKKDAWKVVEKIEKIAKKQVIIATPIGKMYTPIIDNNKLQLHLSAFYPEEFKKRGYKITKFGRKELLGENGLVHKIKYKPLKKMTYLINFLATPLYFFCQPLSNYHFYAYKELEKKIS